MLKRKIITNLLAKNRDILMKSLKNYQSRAKGTSYLQLLLTRKVLSMKGRRINLLTKKHPFKVITVRNSKGSLIIKAHF